MNKIKVWLFNRMFAGQKFWMVSESSISGKLLIRKMRLPSSAMKKDNFVIDYTVLKER